MKSATGLYRRWKTKSVTRKALFISLVFHRHYNDLIVNLVGLC